jgi:hypothetical protein
MCAGSFPVRAYAQQGDIISSQGDPAQTCAEAKAAEEERHRSQLIELQKADIDATKDYNNRLLMCKADRECRKAAKEELDEKRRSIQMQRNEVNAEHNKRKLDISHLCQAERRSAKPQPPQSQTGESLPDSGEIDSETKVPPGAGAGETSPPPSDTAGKIVADNDKFFTDVFNSHGKTYTPPKVKRNPGLARWEEDGKVLVGRPARYNTTTGEIEYSPDYLKLIHDKFSNYEVAVALAHEVGHHVQLSAGQRPVTGKEKEWELQADRLSGAYVGSAMKGKPLAPDVEAELLSFYKTVGSHDPAGHGTPEERLAAFKEGYEHGVPKELFK